MIKRRVAKPVKPISIPTFHLFAPALDQEGKLIMSEREISRKVTLERSDRGQGRDDPDHFALRQPERPHKCVAI